MSPEMSRRALLGIAICTGTALAACATRTPEHGAVRRGQPLRSEAARAAESMIGAPYRAAGRTPRGFDCSGLVIYSYAVAGLHGLPHSAEALERKARPLALAELEPGDLLFFDLDGKRRAHVGIYVGDHAFVHAPSPGKRVERVAFDDVYWGSRIERAGRIAH
jgi:cell wall-associated NlpC family hydrolase